MCLLHIPSSHAKSPSTETRGFFSEGKLREGVIRVIGIYAVVATAKLNPTFYKVPHPGHLRVYSQQFLFRKKSIHKKTT